MEEAVRTSRKRPVGRMQQQAPEAVGMGEMNGQGHSSVLVVDDEPQVAWVLRFSLEHEGYRTYTASNGIEALEELEKHHPAVVDGLSDAGVGQNAFFMFFFAGFAFLAALAFAAYARIYPMQDNYRAV